MNFEKLTKIKVKKIEEKTIIRYPEVYELCYYPYPNHPNGCPNTLNCQWLNVPFFDTIYEYGNYTYFYLVYIEFNFKRYKELRILENPEFFNTEARLKCLIYWQNSVKKILRDYIEILQEGNQFYVLGCGYGFKLSFQKHVASMEAVGINVFSTLKLNNISFELKPKNKIILCSLICATNRLILKKQTKVN